MKLLTKCFLTVAIAAGTFTGVNAQKFTGGVNLMTGLPMGTWSDDLASGGGGAGFGLGGGIDLDYYITDMFAVGLEAGYISFAGESFEIFGISVESSYSMVPVIVKGTYFFGEDEFRPYAGLGIGYYLFTGNVDVAGTSTSQDQNGLGISPRAGLQYSLTDELSLNFNVQYNLLLNETEVETEVTDPNTGATSTQTVTSDATPYLGINVGITYLLMD